MDEKQATAHLYLYLFGYKFRCNKCFGGRNGDTPGLDYSKNVVEYHCAQHPKQL
jgi:hypothetical protein